MLTVVFTMPRATSCQDPPASTSVVSTANDTPFICVSVAEPTTVLPGSWSQDTNAKAANIAIKIVPFMP